MCIQYSRPRAQKKPFQHRRLEVLLHCLSRCCLGCRVRQESEVLGLQLSPLRISYSSHLLTELLIGLRPPNPTDKRSVFSQSNTLKKEFNQIASVTLDLLKRAASPKRKRMCHENVDGASKSKGLLFVLKMIECHCHHH